jgi:hypothetical protein
VKDWKSCERRVAALVGGERVPVSGRERGYSPDIQHERLSIEVKSRKKLPAWIEDAVRQAEASARDGQLPVAVLHHDGRRYSDCLVVLRLKDFVNSMRGEGWRERLRD